MSPALVESVDGGFNDIGGSVEIGLSDLQVHDLFSLSLQGAGLVQDLKGGFSAQARHARGQAEFVLSGRFHGGKNRHYILSRG